MDRELDHCSQPVQVNLVLLLALFLLPMAAAVPCLLISPALMNMMLVCVAVPDSVSLSLSRFQQFLILSISSPCSDRVCLPNCHQLVWLLRL